MDRQVARLAAGHGERQGRHARRAEGDDRAVFRDDLLVEPDIARQIDIDHEIDALAACLREQARGEIVCLAVENDIGAKAEDGIARRRSTARRGDDARAAPFGELHGVGAHAARRAGNIDGLALDRAGHVHRVIAGHGGNAEAGALDETRPGGQALNEARRQRHIFSRRAEGARPLRVVNPDAIALAETRHASAQRRDHARAVRMGHHARKFRRNLHIGPAFVVGGIDAGRVDPDQDFARGRTRRIHFADLDDLVGRTRFFIPTRAHDVSPCRMRRK